MRMYAKCLFVTLSVSKSLSVCSCRHLVVRRDGGRSSEDGTTSAEHPYGELRALSFYDYLRTNNK